MEAENPISQEDFPQDLLSTELQYRRQIVEREMHRVIPDWVLEIPQTEVAYIINPRVLPLKQLSITKFTNLLQDRYGVKLQRPDLNELGKYSPVSSFSNLSEEAIASLLLELPKPVLAFQNGRFPISNKDFVPIRNINITEERIHVIVQGISTIAEVIIAEVAEMMWLAAGGQKRWDELQRSVQLVSYGTGTIIDMGFPFKKLLNPTINLLLETEVLSGERYGADMGSFAPKASARSRDQTNIIYTLDELHILFHRFDLVTGRSEESTLRFAAISKATRGTGIVFVSSELPFDRHIAFLQSFIDTMRRDTR